MRGRRARLESRASVVFLQVSTMLSRGARESRDIVSGLAIDLNKGKMGRGNTDHWCGAHSSGRSGGP